jgi:excisionase family DNA binding protein
MTDLLTIDDVAMRLRVSKDTVRRMIAAHELPVVRLGGRAGRPVRVRGVVLDQLLRQWSVEKVTA